MIGGPHLFKSSEALRYPTAIAGLLTSYGIAIVIQAIYTTFCFFQNRARNREYGEVLETQTQDEAARRGFEDLTDMENKDFRFSL